jgi:hypothetical protein
MLSFLSDASSRGVREALKSLNLEHLAQQPIEAVFLGLADFVCPDGGSIDEGIAREAFIETIADLAQAGISDFDKLNTDQVQTVFELYATHAIQARLCNDIGANVISLPTDIAQVESVQQQLHDFIRRGVSDALAGERTELEVLTADKVLGFVDSVYEQAFAVLVALGDAEVRE